MILIFIAFVLGPWWLAYKKIKAKELDLKPLEVSFKKWLVRCIVFGFIVYLIEVLYFTPTINYNRSQGGGDYSLDLRGFVFGFFGVFLNLIGLGIVGVLEFLKERKE